MRYTINTKAETNAALAKALRSAAAKLDAADLTPGSDVQVGNLRIQVAESQISEKRIWLAANGFEVGSRGRYSAAQDDAWEKHEARVQRAKDAAAKRRAAKEADVLADA